MEQDLGQLKCAFAVEYRQGRKNVEGEIGAASLERSRGECHLEFFVHHQQCGVETHV